MTWCCSCILMWSTHNTFNIIHHIIHNINYIIFTQPPRPRSVSEVGSPSAPPILRIGPGQQRFGVFARDYQGPLHRGLRLPARRADGHHHSLPHLCHRGHCGSHHADLLRGPAGSALLFSSWNPLLRGQMFPGDNRRGNNTAFLFIPLPFVDSFCSRFSTRAPWWQMWLSVHLLALRSWQSRGPAWTLPSPLRSAWESSTLTHLELGGKMEERKKRGCL